MCLLHHHCHTHVREREYAMLACVLALKNRMDPSLNARCESMSDDDLPEYKCTVRADERSRLFKPGYRCPESMTYWELCEYMTTESNKAGFDPLRPKIVSKSRILDYVIFYCVHSRDHGDQSREAKGLAEAQSKRANRSEEATRCLHTRPCA